MVHCAGTACATARNFWPFSPITTANAGYSGLLQATTTPPLAPRISLAGTSIVAATRQRTSAPRRADAAAQRSQQTVEITKQLPPVIQVRTPQDGATVSTPTITVRFSIRTPSGEPVTAIKSLVDGRPV